MRNTNFFSLVAVYSVLIMLAMTIGAFPTQISVAEEQKGTYLVTDNNQHFYDINNCSNEKGSSGGHLSECEDAEKEIREEEEII